MGTRGVPGNSYGEASFRDVPSPHQIRLLCLQAAGLSAAGGNQETGEGGGPNQEETGPETGSEGKRSRVNGNEGENRNAN